KTVPYPALKGGHDKTDLNRMSYIDADIWSGSGCRTLYKHGIAIAKKAVLLTHGFGIRRQHPITSSKCRHEHQQGRARQMKVGDQGIDAAELIARINEDIGVPHHGLDVSRVAGGFQRPNTGGSHGNHAPTLLAGLPDPRADLLADLDPLGVHLMLGDFFNPNRLK